jgi:hypothetical protein
MHRIVRLAAIALFIAAPALAGTTTWQIDPDHTSAQFAMKYRSGVVWLGVHWRGACSSVDPLVQDTAPCAGIDPGMDRQPRISMHRIVRLAAIALSSPPRLARHDLAIDPDHQRTVRDQAPDGLDRARHYRAGQPDDRR